MRKSALLTVVTASSMLFAAPAIAQDDSDGMFYVGGQVGYHDLGAGDFDQDLVDIDDAGVIYGGVIGLEFDIGNSPISLGGEINANLGEGPIDGDYGLTAILGYNINSQTQISLRGGWQEVRLDPYEVVGIAPGTDAALDREFGELDVTADDFMVGVGARYSLSDGFAVRGAVDTVGFDSVRGTISLIATIR